MTESELHIATDGVVTLEPPRPGDAQLLVEERDDEFFRWLGSATSWSVGWTTDVRRDWLQPGEVNVGDYLFPAARGKGYASRAVELLLQHLGRDTQHTVATLLIHPENEASLRLAARLGFVERDEVNGERFFARNV